MNVAKFLKQKSTNMRCWLVAEGFPGPAVVEVPDTIIVHGALELHTRYSDAIKERNFTALHDAPGEMKKVVEFVEGRAELHDKFWRYLELFSDTVSG